MSGNYAGMKRLSRVVASSVMIGILAGCGGDIDLSSLPRSSGTHDSSTATAGAGGSHTGTSGRTAQNAGGTFGVDLAAAGALSVGGRQPPRDRGWGGDGPLPPIEGWLAADEERPFAYRVLTLMAADGSCSLELSTPPVQEKQPAFSPDGRRLAYASDQSGEFQIHVRELATGAVRRVTDWMGGVTFPSWSPDGSKLVMVEGDTELNQNEFGRRILIHELATGETRVIHEGVPNFGGYSAPIFADDDTVLAANGVRLVAISIADGTTRDVVPLTGRIPNPAHPSLSPDRQSFVFNDYCGPSTVNIFFANVDGSTGDTCDNARALEIPNAPPPRHDDDGWSYKRPAWGPFGVIAVEADPEVFLAAEDGSGFVGIVPSASAGIHNLTWAPPDFSVACTP